MRVAVLTSLTRNRHSDGLQNFVLDVNPQQNVDYYAFVDQLYDCQSWNQLPLLDFSRIDDSFYPRRLAKLPKILGFLLIPGYDYYIWHDPYMELAVSPKFIIDNIMGDCDFALFKHPVRNCAYAEINELKSTGAETRENLDGIEKFLLKNQFQINTGLFELPAFMYKNSAKVATAMLTWWELICKYSSRDQVSFPYVAAQHNLTYGIIPGSPRSHELGNSIIPQVRPFWK